MGTMATWSCTSTAQKLPWRCRRIFPAIDMFKSGTRREELPLTNRNWRAR